MSAAMVPVRELRVKARRPVIRLAGNLEQLATRQLGHLASQVPQVAVNKGVHVVEALEIIEARHHRQHVPAQKRVCNDADDGATTATRLNRKGVPRCRAPAGAINCRD